jgi:hypothetical protein
LKQRILPSALGILCAVTFPTLLSAQTGASGSPARMQSGESTVRAQIEQRRGGTQTGTIAISGNRLMVNGRAYVDPEGEVKLVGIDPASSEACFLVELQDSWAVKFVSAKSPDDVLVIGHLKGGSRSGYIFDGVSGVHISAAHFSIMPNGLMMWRDSAVFLYRAGAGMTSNALPDGYYPTERQRGDIETTSVMMIRKDDRGQSANATGMKSAGSLFGMLSGKKTYDFAFYDLVSGRQIDLPYENITQQGDPYDGNGLRRNGHYFWLADWVKLGNRRFAIYFSKGLQELTVTNLDTGVSKLAMKRGLGINGFILTRENGTARVSANWMFKDHTIPDLAAWFDGDAAVVQ